MSDWTMSPPGIRCRSPSILLNRALSDALIRSVVRQVVAPIGALAALLANRS